MKHGLEDREEVDLSEVFPRLRSILKIKRDFFPNDKGTYGQGIFGD